MFLYTALFCFTAPPPTLFCTHVGQAFVGFTAGTGRSWAKHDVLSWYWCHNDGAGLGQEGVDRVLYQARH